jgi:hypothetical protein
LDMMILSRLAIVLDSLSLSDDRIFGRSLEQKAEGVQRHRA